MGYIIVDDDNRRERQDRQDRQERQEDQMRDQMRRSMRGKWLFNGSGVTGDEDRVREAYRRGYRHGWADSETERDIEESGRNRDSRGRFE